MIKTRAQGDDAAINAALIDTIAACGDVNRNVMASAESGRVARARRVVHEWATKLSEHLLPQTRAYHEIWLDGEKVVGHGRRRRADLRPDLPAAQVQGGDRVPPVNDVDVFAQDLGFIAIVEDGELRASTSRVGGGLGATHGDAGDLSARSRT